MILRRFTKHVTDQNWFAVGLDVIVVIVGIFLGLQVQTWYDGRAALAEEARTIEYFVTDLEKNNAALIDRNIYMDNQITLGNFIIEKLDGDEILEEEKIDLEYGIAIAGFTEPLNSFLNSLNAENLSKIRNVRLRRTLDGFVGYVTRSFAVTLNIKTNIEGSLPYINSKSSFSRSSDGVVTAAYDFDELKNDPQYRAYFVNVLGKVINYQLNLLTMIEESEKMIAILKAYQSGEELPEAEFQ